MNSLNQIPQASSSEQKNKNRARVRLAILSVLALHVIVLVPLLVQGCKRQEEVPAPMVETNQPPVMEETNLPPAESHTNLVLPPLPPATNVMTPVVPPTTTVTPMPEAAAGTTYTVVKGDSFYSIGKKFGVSMKAISEANPGVDSGHLKIGQKLNIPSAASHENVVAAGAMEAVGGNPIYIVKSGDTLMKIARQHGTTYKAIKAANGLATDKIKVGQKLKIPMKESAPAPAPEPAPAPGAPAYVPVLPPPTTTNITH